LLKKNKFEVGDTVKYEYGGACFGEIYGEIYRVELVEKDILINYGDSAVMCKAGDYLYRFFNVFKPGQKIEAIEKDLASVKGKIKQSRPYQFVSAQVEEGVRDWGDGPHNFRDLKPGEKIVVDDKIYIKTGDGGGSDGVKQEKTLREIQAEHLAWENRNFSGSEDWHPLLGMQEELGALCHAYLKNAQGIRNNEDHEAGIKDAIGDLTIFLISFCSKNNYNFKDVLLETWERVKKRDWKKNKVDGGVDMKNNSWVEPVLIDDYEEYEKMGVKC